MLSKSDNIETMLGNKVSEVAEELFQSPISRYQIRLRRSMRGSEFIFGFAPLLYYKCHKIKFKRVGS